MIAAVPCAPRQRQRGAYLLTVAMTLLFLIGFVGIAVDLGHLFVVKTELQTALDSCSLAAAQELDGRSDAIDRARSAGKTAGNLNRVNFQSTTWSDKGTIVDTDITFKDSSYIDTADATKATYVQCQHTQQGVNIWLLRALAAFSGASPGYADTQNVGAVAVATRASAQTTCPLPLALKPKLNGTAPNYGFQVGEWVTLYGNKVPGSGEMGWYNLDGSTSASQTRVQLQSPTCGTRVGDVLGTPGAQTSIDVVWNYRFGIYKQALDATDPTQYPDFSGYSYTSVNWTNAVPQNAWSGTPAAGSAASAKNFQIKRLAFASYDDTGTDIKDGSVIVFNNANQLNSYKTLASPGTGGDHAKYGSNRRVEVVPIIGATNGVIDYACMFMLQPLSGPQANVQLEFLGNASAPNSPCTTNGLAGGTAGPLVPVLVR
jgi:Flp pilus assembly protein TadG